MLISHPLCKMSQTTDIIMNIASRINLHKVRKYKNGNQVTSTNKLKNTNYDTTTSIAKALLFPLSSSVEQIVHQKKKTDLS